MCCACGRPAGDRILGSGADKCSDITSCINEQCVPNNLGYDCSEDFECEGDDLFCLDSICARLGQVGDSCLSDEACGGDLICEMGTCSPLLGIGDACVLFTNRCEDGLVCLNECKEPGFVGEECYFDSHCQTGLECLDFVCVDPELVPEQAQIDIVKEMIESETGWGDVSIQEFQNISKTNFAIKFVAIAPGYLVRYGVAEVYIPDDISGQGYSVNTLVTDEVTEDTQLTDIL